MNQPSGWLCSIRIVTRKNKVTVTRMTSSLQRQLDTQQFPNDYQLTNGIVKHAENPKNFQIPPDVIKRHIRPGQFVELRIDSPRFSVHEDAAAECPCPTCNGDMTKPILRHSHPASLMPLPEQHMPSRGWGEDFWVKVEECSGNYFLGTVDNPLAESRLHGLRKGDAIVFHADHILALHDIHRQEIIVGMDVADLKELAQWVSSLRGDE